MKLKSRFILFFLFILAAILVFLYFKYFFTYEQRNIIKRKFETVTGQNLTITLFDINGKVIKRWTKIQKISSGKETRDYIFFYTKEGKYVQIPNSVWYIAEEE